MLAVRNLFKEYNNTLAVKDLSFEVTPGEIFGLLGPNGAGKTTTIRMILNIVKPCSGSISFFGKPVGPNVQPQMGYLPEERGLYRKCKVIDTLRYFGELKGMTRSSAITQARYWLEKMDIGNYCCRRLEELSKGNQQKVQFISSVIHNPVLLILDEPFSGFDPVNQELVRQLIAEFVNSGKMIIISTHQMEIAEVLCNKIIVINKGKEILKGSIDQIKLRFKENSFYIGYEGDAEALKNFPMIKILSQSKDRIKVQLKENIDPVELLRKISSEIKVNHFSAAEPTLYDIYLETIKKAS